MPRDPGHNELDERTQQLLAQLADGNLSGPSRDALDAELAASSELRTALERQRAAISALRGLELEAPARLRETVESARRRPVAPRRRRFAIAGAMAGAAAALALALALIVPPGSNAPTVVEAAQLSDLPATQASVPVDPANSKLLAASVAGVPFPNLHAEFAWKEAGSRSDELGDRATKTVFYERAGQRVGYTILAGDPVDPPSGARQSVQNGVRLSTAREPAGAIVTWLRGGHTCVLSGPGVSAKDLREVAAWKGDGAVPF